MRPPSKPEEPEFKADPSGPVKRDPSYPDRARIDSDVRAFLRPVSSPWIVFDRDSKVDFGRHALRVGAVFTSSPGIGELPVDESAQRALAEAPKYEPSVIVKQDA